MSNKVKIPIVRQYKDYHQLNEFERGRITSMKETGFSLIEINNRVCETYQVVLRCCSKGSREGIHRRRHGLGRPHRISELENHHLRLLT